MGNGLRLWQRGGLRCIRCQIGLMPHTAGGGGKYAKHDSLSANLFRARALHRDRPRMTSAIWTSLHRLYVSLVNSKQISRPFPLVSEDVICGLTGRQNRRHFMSAKLPCIAHACFADRCRLIGDSARVRLRERGDPSLCLYFVPKGGKMGQSSGRPVAFITLQMRGVWPR